MREVKPTARRARHPAKKCASAEVEAGATCEIPPTRGAHDGWAEATGAKCLQNGCKRQLSRILADIVEAGSDVKRIAPEHLNCFVQQRDVVKKCLKH